MQPTMPNKAGEDEFSGYLQASVDYDVYEDFFEFAEDYYNYEHAIRDALRVYQENPHLFRRAYTDLPNTPEDGEQSTWG